MAKITSVTWKNSYWDFIMEVDGKSHNILCRKDDKNASVLRCDFQTEKTPSVVTDCIKTICYYMTPSLFKDIAFYSMERILLLISIVQILTQYYPNE